MNSHNKHQNSSFTSATLAIASPDQIRSWSYGEVTKPETINYRTGRPERNGLFDERIFGPEKDYACYCGKYKGIRYKGIVCEKCNVEITRSIVRRERMGHIELASPVSHIWMLRSVPSRMSLILNVAVGQLEKVVYFAGYIVTSVDEVVRAKILKDLEQEYKTKLKQLENEEDQEKLETLFKETRKEVRDLKQYRVLNEIEYHNYVRKYSTLFEAGIGAEALFEIFKKINLEQLSEQLEKDLETANKTTRPKAEKRLVLVRSLLGAKLRPEWMFLQVLPVIPPALRPMVSLDGARYATSDVNDLYRRVINRNNRLKKLLTIGAPDVILRNEKRILQEAVDALMDNSVAKGSGGNAAMSQSQRRKLKSLSDALKGKAGIFRANLLGKRVDYSGRSVIVVGPRLRLDQCGLPKYMALELFRPFVIAEMMKREVAFNIRGASRLIEEGAPEVWSILEYVIDGKYVLLNRAPTLHRLSIQAFKPVLIEGKAIQLHPLACAAFNADFDGDQMAVHLPLSLEAQREARELIAGDKNILKPQTGDPIATPSQDMVLGCFWMTKQIAGAKGEGSVYASINDALTAYDYDAIDLHATIKVKPTDKPKYAQFNGEFFETTAGRLLFNTAFPDETPYFNEVMSKKALKNAIKDAVLMYGVAPMRPILDRIKEFGFYFATKSGSTFGMDEPRVPRGKAEVIEAAHKKVAEINDNYDEGLISDLERYRMTITAWEEAKSQVGDMLADELSESESLYDIMISGSRGNPSQLNQASGMKGIIVNAKGRELDFPIVSCYKEGFTPLEYFYNTTTARKGLTDTALNTAKAGYLTRRLHDVAQDVVIRQEDCGTRKGIVVKAVDIDGIQRSLSAGIYGRVLAKSVKGEDGKKVASAGDLVTRELAKTIEESGAEEVMVRSPLKCESRYGLCQKCYGMDLGRRGMVKQGEAVGTIASQAIGEPGTQLTLRTFHLGGVKGRDITQGLPRVEEIFERRAPKVPAVLSKETGFVTEIKKEEGQDVILVTSDTGSSADKGSLTQAYLIDPRRIVTVKVGENVKKGQALTDGSLDPLELYELAGEETAQKYLIDQIDKVYELHGTAVDRKHLEIIVRLMFSRYRIVNPGDSSFTTGQIVEKVSYLEANEELKEAGKMPVKATVVPKGISDVSLSTRSWLSAASFQHTSRVLIGAAVKGAKDELRGLKENVIVGNLIPAGTGFSDDFIDMAELGDQTLTIKTEEDEDKRF